MSGERIVTTNHSLWLIAGAAIISPFMEVLDTSIANVALPYIAGNLSSSLDEAVWVLYVVPRCQRRGAADERLVLSPGGTEAVLPAFDPDVHRQSISLRHRPQPADSYSFPRAAGVGGGGLQPTTQAILADLFPKERIASAFTLYSVVIVLAPTLGPVLGGWLSDHWGWRWICFLNIPCGIAA